MRVLPLCLCADDCWENGNLYETTSILMEKVVDENWDHYDRHFPVFASRPYQPLEFDDDWGLFVYGKAQYAFFLRDRYFDGAAFSGQSPTGRASSGWR